MLGPTPRRARITLCLFNFLSLASLVECYPSQSPQNPLDSPDGANAQITFNAQTPLPPLSQPSDSSSPSILRHVAIATSFARSDVYDPLAWVASTIMTKYAEEQLPTSLNIYSSEPSFLSLLKRISVLPPDTERSDDPFGTLPSNIIRPRDQLTRDIRSTTLYNDDEGAMIDLVVLGSCEIDLERFGPDLLKAWDERPNDKKFTLACGVHNQHNTGWYKYISEWSRRDSLRVIPMSNRIVDYVHSTFNTQANSKGLVEGSSVYEHIKVGAFYSVSEFLLFPLRPKSYLADVPCSAVLRGGHRDRREEFERILHDLARLLREDSQGWGYRWSAEERKYAVDHTTPYPPFVLHLVGGDPIDVPSELQEAVVKSAGSHIHQDITPLYELFQSIDIVLPVFADRGSHTPQESSIVHAATMGHVPLLAARGTLQYYPYLASGGVIIRPSAISEMEAIGLFRGANVPVQDASSELAEDTKRMLNHGWKRNDESFLALKREILEQNGSVTMVFGRLSAQRTIFAVILVGCLFVTHQTINTRQTESTGLTEEESGLWQTPQQPVKPQKSGDPSKPIRYAIPTKGEDNPLKTTTLVKHAPGWTIFDNVYVSGGTLYIVTDNPSEWPAIRMMTSTGLPSENTPGNAESREPTDKEMRIISMKDAEKLWGKRVWPVNGVSFLVNDPRQFVSHYYHFVAETWLGLWRIYSSLDPDINVYGETKLESPVRVIWPHCKENEWRDYSTFNQYFMHAVFPSITVETQLDWEGRAKMTESKGTSLQKAFRYDRVVLSDRSAAKRGIYWQKQNGRIASEAWQATKNESSRYWWEPVRRSVLRYAGVEQKTIDMNVLWAKEWNGVSNGDEVPTDQQIEVAKTASKRMPIVITYIVRSGTRRIMKKEDHEDLVKALTELCKRKSWELNVVRAEKLTKDEQLQLAARTTIMLGVHGNGLTHLTWMPLTPVSTVIEFFFPGGFTKDYEWTTRALGMRHYGVWNDTYFTHPKEPRNAFPEGFQGNQIPVHGPSIAKLIEDRVEGRLP
ncbi:hypothetical protein FRC01_003755 [Tulasnella sp. 417]|nr:hypothetical protein FRC01_003755 [Tulasnella sp. 417]